MKYISFNEGRDMCVFYHIDNDGKAAAAIIQQLYPEAWCYSINHGIPIKWELIGPNIKTIVVVDFSFPLAEMKKMAKDYNLIWIDHHPVVEEYKAAGFECEGLCECKPGRSGALLTWEYFHPGEEPPMAIKYISDYDTWQFDYGEDTKSFNAALMQMELMPINKHMKDWNKLFKDNVFVEKLIATGVRIQDYVKTRNRMIVNDCAFKTEIGGVPALACNFRDADSSLFESIGSSKYPYRMLFKYFSNIGRYRVSIYSVDPEEHPANEMAKKYGGNGHSGAAGFTAVVGQLPFALPQPKEKEEFTWDNYYPLLDILAKDPLANKYANTALPSSIYSSQTTFSLDGIKCIAINHPCIFTNTFYVTGLHLQYDIGVLWNLCKNGWYRHRYYSLNPLISVKDLVHVYKVAGPNNEKPHMIRDDSVWVYEKEPICFKRDESDGLVY